VEQRTDLILGTVCIKISYLARSEDLPNFREPVIWIRITLMRIRIGLFVLMHDADPDPDPSFQIKAQTIEKVL
jgi:hypothetical protein